MMHINADAAVEAHLLGDDGVIPNNPRLAALVYRGVLEGADPAAGFERMFAANGWSGGWRDGIYDFHHFHSNTHEVLGIASGTARVLLGGDGGATVEVAPGDMLVIPAGVGHKALRASPDLVVVGAYPDGRAPDMNRADPEDRRRALPRIAAVPLPAADPALGPDGPLRRYWNRDGQGMF
jgi:uncharacterized protein YjlB